ncbi:MAG TPA: tetratricopeptide repeat protein, partial [Gemmatimonadales bacterium]|nr:tetratricopeptide repeat protein [Gemmatimonadales bacterium]
LLVAGLFNEAQTARKAGRKDEAARLTTELVAHMPGDPAATLIAAQSQLQDKNDARGALATLAALQVPDSNFRLVMGKGLAIAQAYQSLGLKDSARFVLEGLKQKFPQSRRIQEALDKLR